MNIRLRCFDADGTEGQGRLFDAPAVPRPHDAVDLGGERYIIGGVDWRDVGGRLAPVLSARAVATPGPDGEDPQLRLALRAVPEGGGIGSSRPGRLLSPLRHAENTKPSIRETL